jgi:N-methylhydantoinase A
MAGVVVPLHPGVFSAIGLLMADVRHDHMRSRLMPLAEAQPEEMNDMLDRLVAEATVQLAHDGFRPERVRIERALDMRYAGQGYEVTLPCPLSATDLPALRAAFDAQHKAMFGHFAPQAPVEIVSFRVRGIGLVPQVEIPKFKRGKGSLVDAQRGERRVRFEGAEVECRVYWRTWLDVGLTIPGPAVIDQLDSTTLICPGQVACVDEWKNLIVTEGDG